MKSHITKDVLDFLKLLSKNNNRDWFNENKTRFKSVESQVKLFHAEIFERLSKIDYMDSFKLFRIYRDVRFSHDKSPYKTHFGCSFRREKPAYRGGYYVHIKPNESFVAVGFWEPNSSDLKRIRQELDYEASGFRDMMNDKKLKTVWGGLQGEQLKTAPRDFAKNHPDIDLLRYKQFLLIKNFADEELLQESFAQNVSDSVAAARPFVDWMSNALTTNLNGESII